MRTKMADFAELFAKSTISRDAHRRLQTVALMTPLVSQDARVKQELIVLYALLPSTRPNELVELVSMLLADAEIVKTKKDGRIAIKRLQATSRAIQTGDANLVASAANALRRALPGFYQPAFVADMAGQVQTIADTMGTTALDSINAQFRAELWAGNSRASAEVAAAASPVVWKAQIVEAATVVANWNQLTATAVRTHLADLAAGLAADRATPDPSSMLWRKRVIVVAAYLEHLQGHDQKNQALNDRFEAMLDPTNVVPRNVFQPMEAGYPSVYNLFELELWKQTLGVLKEVQPTTDLVGLHAQAKGEYIQSVLASLPAWDDDPYAASVVPPNRPWETTYDRLMAMLAVPLTDVAAFDSLVDAVLTDREMRDFRPTKTIVAFLDALHTAATQKKG
jgi:hypothetical protein